MYNNETFSLKKLGWVGYWPSTNQSLPKVILLVSSIIDMSLFTTSTNVIFHLTCEWEKYNNVLCFLLLTPSLVWLKPLHIFWLIYVVDVFSLHWSLVIICIPDKEDETGPIILHLDSLRLHSSRSIFENIKRWDKKRLSWPITDILCLISSVLCVTLSN